MKTELKAKLEKVIDDFIEDNAGYNFWDEYIHPELGKQMANAAEQVFDATMSVQEFIKHNV
jgi:hypothetical protein